MPVKPGAKPVAPAAKPTLVKPKATAPAEVDMSQFASNNPDEMLQGGLPNDIDGLVTKARYVPWNYGGKIEHHVLGVALTIQPYNENGEPEGDEFVQTYSAGDLEQFVPCMDGINAVDLNAEDPDGTGEVYEGIYAKRVGKREQMNNNTNWAAFNSALKDAGFDISKFTPAVTYAEGLFGHWDRVPQKKRAGLVQTDEDANKKRELLVITELKPLPGTAAAPAKKAAPATKPIVGKKPVAPVVEEEVEEVEDAAAYEADELDVKLFEIIGGMVVAAGDEGLPKGKIAGALVKSLKGTEKAEALKRINSGEILESGGNEQQWVFDPETGILYNNA